MTGVFQCLRHPRVVVSTAAFHARVRGSVPGLGGLKEAKMFLPHPRVKVSIVGSLRDLEVACSASDRQGSNFEFCVWRAVSSQSSHHPQEVLLAQFSIYLHKGGLKPDSFHFYPRPPYPPKWIYLNFHPHEVVSRYRDPQPQVVKNYANFFNLRINIYKILMFKQSFNSQYQWLNRLMKRIITTVVVISTRRVNPCDAELCVSIFRITNY